ncbi:MAG: hypothetical protein JKY56_04835 [Kofleriaceae bacterium]|nr:hypothetical protein [Kofleriaceae bacterium]
MQLEVIGIKAKATEEAKWQAMRIFLKWYAEANKHLAVEMQLSWLDSRCRLFLLAVQASEPASYWKSYN